MAYSNGYDYRRTITVDQTKVAGSSDFTDFPILFYGTYSYLATVANGGLVTSSSGNDIRFETTGGTKLDHELVRYVSTTGEIEAWIRIPTLLGATDTTIYIYYGKSGASAEANPTGTWTNYAAVYQMEGNGNDSCTTPLNATTSNVTFGTTNAKIGQNASFNGSNSTFLSSTRPFDLPSALTISGWFYLNNTNQIGDFFGLGGTGGSYGYKLRIRNTSGESAGKRLYIVMPNVANNDTGYDFNATGWYYLTLRRSSGTWVAKVNATNAPNSNSNTPNTPGQSMAIGSDYESGSTRFYLNGRADHVTWIASALSDDWITTEYNNQNSPSTFYALGSQEVSTLAVTVSDSITVSESHSEAILTTINKSESISVSENRAVVTSDPQIPLWGPNLIENPGFEADADGTTEPSKWDTFNNPGNIQRRVSTEFAHSGTKSYKINTTDAATADCGILQNEFSGRTGTIAVVPNTQYRFSSFIKTALTDGQVHTHIKLFEPGYAGETGLDTDEVTGTNNWTANDLVFTTGANQTIAEIWVCFGAYGNPANGQAWFDDFALQRNEGDLISVTESAQVSIQTAINKSEAVSVAENTSLSVQTTIAKSDSIAVAESVTTQIETKINKSEAVSVGESQKLTLESQVQQSDTVGVAEAVKVEVHSFINTNDSVGVTESVKLLEESNVAVNDAIATNEHLSLDIPTNITVSDSVAVSENTKTEIASFINVSESIGVAENTSQVVNTEVAASENIAVDESIVIDRESETKLIEVAENIAVAENSQVILVSTPQVSDSIGVAESTSIVVSDPQVTVLDTIQITENETLILIPLLGESENISVSEAVKVVVESDIRTSENVGVAESISIDNTRSLTVQDTVQVDENTSLVVPVNMQASENVAVVDTPQEYVETKVNVADQIGVVDQNSLQPIQVDLVAQDNVLVVDAPTILRIEPDLHLSVSDNITVTDTPVQFDIRYVDEVARKLIMVEGRLAYLITGRYGSLPQYVFI